VETDVLDDALARVTASSKVLVGYFQRHTIVDRVASELLARFQTSPRLRELVDGASRPAIAVHIRCGDYLSPRALAFHGLTSASSLLDALQQAAKESGHSKVVVVSDDPARARAMMDVMNIRTVFDLEYSAGANPWDDLQTLSTCAAVVMNNSSFSWWGGYLASRCRSAVVFAPTPWYARASGVESVLFDPYWRVYQRMVLSSGELT
jgi:hypothetical protein